MSVSTENAEHREGPGTPGLERRAPRFAFVLVSLILLASAGAVSAFWLTHRPRPVRRAPQVTAVGVETQSVQTGNHRVTVAAMGAVVPARSIDLAARVGGPISETSREFLPGGHFEAGQQVLKVDPEDYELAVERQEIQIRNLEAQLAQQRGQLQQAEAELVRTESNLTMELGEQSVAQREYELLGDAVTEEDLELVLRKPQLRIAQADCEAAKAAREASEAACEAAAASVESAKVALRQARLDLERTAVRAPFNAVVRSRYVDLGSEVSVGARLAELVGTDEYWVEVLVPVDEFRWITIPTSTEDKGSTARVYYNAAWGPERCRIGHVVRVATDLELEGRLAKLIVSVPDPLGLHAQSDDAPPLPLGAYVQVSIEGAELEDVVSVPRAALHDGDRVWIMEPDGTLGIRQVSIARAGLDFVLVGEGLQSGERLVLSNLSTPVPGLLLREAGAPSSSAGMGSPAEVRAAHVAEPGREPSESLP